MQERLSISVFPYGIAPLAKKLRALVYRLHHTLFQRL
jgi:hypothetical protein